MRVTIFASSLFLAVLPVAAVADMSHLCLSADLDVTLSISDHREMAPI